jgi:hypothetical protein
MPPVCTICSHPKRAEIEKAHLAGQAIRAIARRCGTSRDAIMRHVENHLPARMVKGAERRQIAEGSDLVERLLDLNRQTLDILKGARRSRKHDLALKAIARAESQLELQARLAGEIRDGLNIVNVQLDPATAERMARVFLERRARPMIEIPAAAPEAILAETVEEGE